MSQTYSLGCRNCNEKLWIGQGWDSTPDERYIYKTDLHIQNLQEFLFKHKDHELVFGDDEDGELGDFRDINDSDDEEN